MTQDPATIASATTPATSPATRPSAVVAATPEMIRSEEQFRVSTQPVVAERVIVRRRIVTEERTVLVQVRREELVVERVSQPAHPGAPGTPGVADTDPLVIVLHQEVPDVVLRTEAYERVTVSKHRISGDQTVRADLQHEVVELERDVLGIEDPRRA